MQIELPLRSAQCAKPGCSARFTGRHHTGCEFMWIRHFKHRKRTKTYKAFVARYKEFHPDDCVELCNEHHKEIHQLYWIHICNLARRERVPFKTWSWALARLLMHDLRAICYRWLEHP